MITWATLATLAVVLAGGDLVVLLAGFAGALVWLQDARNRAEDEARRARDRAEQAERAAEALESRIEALEKRSAPR